MEQPQVEVSRNDASLSVVGQNLSAFPESVVVVRSSFCVRCFPVR
jgi:hypothetical protein